MMFLLVRDILFHLFKVGLAHRESRVAALPFKIGVVAAMFFEPAVGNAFQFLHPLRLREGAAKTAEQMNMVFHPADDERRAFERLGNAAQVGMQGVTRGFVAEEGATFLRRKDEVNIDAGERLGHGVSVVANPMRGGRRNGRNRVAVENILRTDTQGSSCLATLGWRPESRWDSHTAACRGGGGAAFTPLQWTNGIERQIRFGCGGSA